MVAADRHCIRGLVAGIRLVVVPTQAVNARWWTVSASLVLCAILGLNAWDADWAAFLWYCRVGLLVTTVACVAGSPRLFAVAMAATLAINIAWMLDVLCMVLGIAETGMTTFVCDPAEPWQVRVATWYHALIPLVGIPLLMHIGYDRRAFVPAMLVPVVAIGGVHLGMAVGLLPPSCEINFVDRGPWIGAGGDPLYGLAHIAFIIVGVVWPGHIILMRLCPPYVDKQAIS